MVYVLRDGELSLVRSLDHGQSWERRPAFSHALLAQHPELQKLTSLAGEPATDRAQGRAGSGLGTSFWAGCGDALCHIDMGTSQEAAPTIERWGTAEGVPRSAWLSLFSARDGLLWARSRSMLLSVDPRTRRVRTYQELLDPAPSHAISLVEDPQGRMLINLKGGLARLEGDHWTAIGAQNGLVESRVQAMLFDRSGGLWLAPTGHGVLHWRGYGQWQGWTEAQGLSSNLVWDIVKDPGGRLWFATDAGLDRYVPPTGRDGQPHIVAEQVGKAWRGAESARADARGHIWEGSSKGVLVDFDPARHQQRTIARDFESIYSIFRDREERIWICSRRGLAYFSPQERWSKIHIVNDPGAPAANAWTIVEDGQGRLWVSAEQGLYRLENGHWDHIDVPATRLLHAYPLLAPGADGTLWIQGALPKPLIRVKVEGTTAQVVESVDQRTIESDNLTFLSRDGRGWLWVGTDAGVYINDGSRWVHVTEEDGLIWDDTDANSFLADPDGSVWIGTSAGLAHLLHPEELARARTPAVWVTHAAVGGIELREHELVTLGLRRPTLSASLFSTEYDRPKAVEFRYQLEGLDPEWQPVQGEGLRISQLPAGRYTLRIMAVDSRRHVQSAPIEFSFEILRPWWQRTWFRVVERIGVLLMVLFFWRASVRLLVSRQHELENLVSMRTRELEREKAELLEARTTLIEMNRRDALTGLLNRSAIFEQLARERERAVENGGLLAVVMADLDHFKEINDQYGHLFGDAVIRVCAQRLQDTLRPGDSVGRYGGEELLLLIPGLRPESAEVRLEELRRAIAAEPVTYGEASAPVTCSFGLAWVEATGGTPEQEMEAAIASADAALYQAKQNGRNQVVLATALMSEQ